MIYVKHAQSILHSQKMAQSLIPPSKDASDELSPQPPHLPQPTNHTPFL